jgi:hypothetical protein
MVLRNKFLSFRPVCLVVAKRSYMLNNPSRYQPLFRRYAVIYSIMHISIILYSQGLPPCGATAVNIGKVLWRHILSSLEPECNETKNCSEFAFWNALKFHVPIKMLVPRSWLHCTRVSQKVKGLFKKKKKEHIYFKYTETKLISLFNVIPRLQRTGSSVLQVVLIPSEKRHLIVSLTNY